MQWLNLSVADIETRLNIFQKDASDLKASLEFSQKDIDELKPCKSKLDEIEADVDDMNNSFNYHIDKLEYLENQSRTNNIKRDGLVEVEENESWNTTAEKRNKFSQKSSTLLIAPTSNALIVLVELLMVLENALVQLSGDFATGGKRM